MSKIKQETAFVLYSFPFSNSSLILRLFTEHSGKQSFIIKGAFRNTKKFPRAYFTLFRKLQVIFYLKEGRDLSVVKEISPVAFYDFSDKILEEKLLINTFAELIEKSVYPELPNPQLFYFIDSYLQKLSAFVGDPDFHYYHWAELLGFLGIRPLLEVPSGFVRLNIPEGNFEPAMTELPDMYLFKLFQKKRYPVSETFRRKAIQILWEYYKYHLPGFQIPKSYRLYTEINSPAR